MSSASFLGSTSVETCSQSFLYRFGNESKRPKPKTAIVYRVSYVPCCCREALRVVLGRTTLRATRRTGSFWLLRLRKRKEFGKDGHVKVTPETQGEHASRCSAS